MSDRSRGLYNKYQVSRSDGQSAPGGKYQHCEYFVLDLDNDKFADIALQAYADACKEEYPILAKDLTARVRSTKRESS